jgi:hypothetical protein
MPTIDFQRQQHILGPIAGVVQQVDPFLKRLIAISLASPGCGLRAAREWKGAVMLKRLAFLTAMCVAGPAWAASTFVVDFPVASTPQTTCGGRYLVPNLPVWRLYDPIIDLRGVTKFLLWRRAQAVPRKWNFQSRYH